MLATKNQDSLWKQHVTNIVNRGVQWVMVMLVLAGFVIIHKSRCEPPSEARWLGKVVDVQTLKITSSSILVAKILATLVYMFDFAAYV